MELSKTWRLNFREKVKGVVLVIVGSIIAAVQNTIAIQGSFPITWTEWKMHIATGFFVGATYVFVTFLSNDKPTTIMRVLNPNKIKE